MKYFLYIFAVFMAILGLLTIVGVVFETLALLTLFKFITTLLGRM